MYGQEEELKQSMVRRRNLNKVWLGGGTETMYGQEEELKQSMVMRRTETQYGSEEELKQNLIMNNDNSSVKIASYEKHEYFFFFLETSNEKRFIKETLKRFCQ